MVEKINICTVCGKTFTCVEGFDCSQGCTQTETGKCVCFNCEPTYRG
jgi:hypothetical protein